MSDTEKFFLALVLLVAYACVSSCAVSVFPTLRHPRASQGHDFTKPVPEIPEQYWNRDGRWNTFPPEPHLPPEAKMNFEGIDGTWL